MNDYMARDVSCDPPTPEPRDDYDEWRDEQADCHYPQCPVTAVSSCDSCDRRFCPDHGSPGGDRETEDVGMVAHPAVCWSCGGFNVDAGAVELGLRAITTHVKLPERP